MSRPRERGSAVIPALTMLTLLAAVAALGVAGGGADLLLATRLTRERAAFYAAESALATSLAELADAGLPAACFSPPWPAPEPADRSWEDAPWRCRRRLVPLPDAGDADGDPETTAVLFNRAFGYAGAPRATGGYPVFQLLASAEGGGSRAAVVAEVTPVACAPAAAAAWTAGGPVTLEGDAFLSGVAAEGAGADAPAILARGAVQVGDGARVEGARGEDGRAVATDPGLALPADALALLNAGETLRSLDELPPPPAAGPLAGLLWARGDYAGSLDGEGILVVHNPSFDPVRYEASRLALEEGVRTEGWDPAYSHLDAAHRPARLEVVRGGTFSGVIVADAIGACDQAFTLQGALVTTTRSPLMVRAALPLRVERSTAAIERAGRGPLRHLTAFRPLPATEERVP